MAWATSIAFHLNGRVLPGDYYAMPWLPIDGQVEDAEIDSFEVQVFRNLGGPQPRAAIELVSPSNKDRPGSRRAFAAKCAGYLRKDISVIVIDIVTERPADLHAEIMHALDDPGGPPWDSPTRLYASSYRCVLTTDPPLLEAWPEVLSVGLPLPVLPLWLEADLSVPLPLEESYVVTCGSLRMRG